MRGVERGGEEVAGHLQRDDAEVVRAVGNGVDVCEERGDGGVGGFFGEVAADAGVNEGEAEEVDDGEKEFERERCDGCADEVAEGCQVWERGFTGAGCLALDEEGLHVLNRGDFAGGPHLVNQLGEGGHLRVCDWVKVGALQGRQLEICVGMWRVCHLD